MNRFLAMPVIITNLPEIAFEIEKEKAGVVIRYDKDELAKAITLLLKNDVIYKMCRANALKLSKKYIWSNIFRRAYKDTLEYFN